MGDIAKYLGDAGTRAALWSALLDHVYLSLLPLVISVVLAIGLGLVCHRYRRVNGFLVGLSNAIYTVPSLALFAIIPAVIGTQVLDPLNVVIALTIYTTALLVRPVVEALNAVPAHVTAAATAMGFRPWRRFLTVELPLSVPVLAAGVRVGSVSNISLVSVGALIGSGGLGTLFTDGFRQRYLAPIIVGIVLTLVLALVVDLVLLALRNALTPWTRAGRP
ncbi:ABC transporter permease [Actinosynnema sp. NPDC047251]|uniref:ABC-type glycine/betaine transporter, permease subunit n=1 Tax=Saccharothrix espanaensis (strain ATCC 51144 / DSM 44229 / JCM 9112 / NBRC 15066 / NRRL 15764) TaxID=1179773 RepID=K0K3E7_SACES|nr:ABC transporter permease [Saccharothrix espanaensis]CCH34770.1 ABC-type glycine/betaine transporter, permease subunit [Saccharothrix espanaensis DSM 44229]